MSIKAKLTSLVIGLSLSSSVFAVDPQATFVFEGYVPSVVPTAEYMITGIGGVGIPAKGTLTISSAGSVTTSVPVLFEVRKNDGTQVDPLAGDLAKDFNVKLISTSLTAGSAAVDNSSNKVQMNLADIDQNVPKAGLSGTNRIDFKNDAGFDIEQVGPAAAVQASVVVLIENIV